MTEKSAQGFFIGTKQEFIAMEAIMNIENDPELIHLELKYCERCAGLWLRLYGTQDVYCAPCRAAATNLPAHRRKATKPRLPGEQRFDLKAQGKARTLQTGGRG